MKRNRGNTMKEFTAQVLFSGLINITVEAETEEEAIQYAEDIFTKKLVLKIAILMKLILLKKGILING